MHKELKLYKKTYRKNSIEIFVEKKREKVIVKRRKIVKMKLMRSSYIETLCICVSFCVTQMSNLKNKPWLTFSTDFARH